jgi:hypothetical protein
VRGRVRLEVDWWLLSPAVADVVLAQGWADRAHLEAVAAGARAWAERPDAFRAFLHVCALGWAGPATPPTGESAAEAPRESRPPSQALP